MRDLFLPTAASTLAGEVDALYLFLSGLTFLISLGIAGAIVFFAVRYHHARRVDRAGAPAGHLGLELTWIILPLIASAIIFVWSARVFLKLNTPPEDAETVYVLGLQWMWKIQHPQGPREINTLHVPVGRPIRLVLTSQDVIHSFYVPAFRIKKDVLPGRYTEAWFEATRPGRYHLFCAEFCGTQHAGMIGAVVALSPEAFQDWLAMASASGGAAPGIGAPDAGTLAAAGERLYQSLGCSGCHEPRSPIRAPNLRGLFGRPVPLQGGGFATADETYLRESIYFPQRKVVAGYDPVMPSFQGVIGEEDVLALIAYIRSLGAAKGEGP